MKYTIVDRHGEPITEQEFDSERKAVEAMRVYDDNCSDIDRPLKVVRIEEAQK